MRPTDHHAATVVFGDVGRVRYIPTAVVMSRLDDAFEEPLSRVAMLPGYVEHELSLAGTDGWPAASEPLALTKLPGLEPGDKDRWAVVSGLHVLARAKKLDKERVPCFFLNRDEIGKWQSAISGHGLRAPTPEPDEDELLVRAFYSADG